MFNFMALTPFYFMPILVAYGTSRVLKSNPAFAIAMAAALLYPDFNAIMAAGEPVSMFGLPVHLGTYGNSLLPGIFQRFSAPIWSDFSIASYQAC